MKIGTLAALKRLNAANGGHYFANKYRTETFCRQTYTSQDGSETWIIVADDRRVQVVPFGPDGRVLSSCLDRPVFQNTRAARAWIKARLRG